MESLSMVSHTNALIKNRETIDINLYDPGIDKTINIATHIF